MQHVCRNRHQWLRLAASRCRRFVTASPCLMSQNHYKVLNVQNDASQTDIKAAFLKLSKQVHPDKNPNDPNTHNKFVRVNEAYSILINPVSRRDYDQSLRFQHVQHPYPSAEFRQHHQQEYRAEGEQTYWGDDYIYYMRARSGQYNYGAKGSGKDPQATKSKIQAFKESIVLLILGVALFFWALKASSENSQRSFAKNQIYIAQLHKARMDARNTSREEQIEQLYARFDYLQENKSPQATQATSTSGPTVAATTPHST